MHGTVPCLYSSRSAAARVALCVCVVLLECCREKTQRPRLHAAPSNIAFNACATEESLRKFDPHTCKSSGFQFGVRAKSTNQKIKQTLALLRSEAQIGSNFIGPTSNGVWNTKPDSHSIEAGGIRSDELVPICCILVFSRAFHDTLKFQQDET